MVPEGWKLVSLGEVATIQKGRHVQRASLDGPVTDDAVPYIGASTIDSGEPDGWAIHSHHAVLSTASDTVILWDGERSGLSKYGLVGAVGSTAARISPTDPTLHPKFLGISLANSYHWIRSQRTGQAVPHVPKDLETRLTFLLPPVPEQSTIAEILSSVDDAIAATQRVIDQTERVKRGLLQTLMTRGIGHTRFKQTEIGETPETWDVVELDAACERIGVGIASSATHAYTDNGVPLLRNQNVGEGELLLNDLLHVTYELDAEYASKRITSGDVVTMRTGNPGRSAVVPPELHGAQTLTTLIFRPGSRLRGSYLANFLNGPGRRQVLAFQAGGAQPNLNVGVAKRIRIGLPSLAEQDRIEGVLSMVRSDVTSTLRSLRSLQSLKRGLMQDLLTGRVRVKVT